MGEFTCFEPSTLRGKACTPSALRRKDVMLTVDAAVLMTGGIVTSDVYQKRV